MKRSIMGGFIGKVVCSLVTVIAVVCCTVGALYAAEDPFTIITSVPPHAFAIERLTGGQVKVVSLVDQGSDPHTYEPTPKQMLTISQATLFFTTGLEFERGLLSRISSINTRLVIITLGEGHEHDAEPEPGDTHNHEDQHTWLSPRLYAQQVDTIYAALLKGLPEQAAMLTTNYDQFKEQLRMTDHLLQKRLAPYAGRVFYVFHPAFGHFAEAYGLQQEAVEVGSKQPSARQLQALIQQSKAKRIKVIFAQPQFDQRSAAVVATAIAGKIAILNPLEKNVLNNYAAIAESLVQSFQ